MANKATVVDLLQRIITLLESKSAVAIEPIPQPRKITDRFTDNGNGTVSDAELKVAWVKDPSKVPGLEKTFLFSEAKAACENLSYAGYNSGWRMPTLKEEQSIRDYTRYDPAWNTDVFGGNHDNWYWTSTECAWNKDAAWCVFSGYGIVGNSGKDGRSYVRPVRIGDYHDYWHHFILPDNSLYHREKQS